MLAVIRVSEAFSDFWPQLAQHAGVELTIVHPGEIVGSLSGAAAVLVAAGGAEQQAPAAVRAARTAGAREVGVVGTLSDYRVVVSLCQSGATDYFAVPQDLSALRVWVADRADQRRSTLRARSGAARPGNEFSGIVGSSPALNAALDEARRIIPRGDVTVLVTGETGTGKELLAQAIHRGGPRAEHPLVEINCAALPAPLIESELFGYERGAFTDARTPKAGLLEVANRGTLFLDEVAEMALGLQAKLLRVLDSRRVRRVGGLRETEVDVRLIAATHADLRAAVAAGSFREDLFYRLAVVPIRLPALRERGNDVIILAEHFLETFGRQYGVAPPPLSSAARRALLAHDWPGNVRELKNAVERAVVLADGELGDFRPLGAGAAANGAADAPFPFPASLRRINRAVARATLERFDGNKSEAARVLGVTRKHLYSLLAPTPAGMDDA